MTAPDIIYFLLNMGAAVLVYFWIRYLFQRGCWGCETMVVECSICLLDTPKNRLWLEVRMGRSESGRKPKRYWWRLDAA